MASTYKAGSKDAVLRRMAEYAIRDQDALIDAYSPRFGEPDEEAASVIQAAKDNIADFRRLLKTLPAAR